MRHSALLVLGLSVGLLAAGTGLGYGQEELPDRSSRAAKSQKATGGRLEQTLDHILEVQQAILARFDEVMEDLRVAKVRSSR